MIKVLVEIVEDTDEVGMVVNYKDISHRLRNPKTKEEALASISWAVENMGWDNKFVIVDVLHGEFRLDEEDSQDNRSI